MVSSPTMLDVTRLGPEKLRPLRREEYDRLIELGAFEDERVELLSGMLVAMSPQGARHAHATMRLHELLLRALGDRAEVRSHSPLSLPEDSEPESDVAVVPPGDYSREHPSGAYLVVEVADSSLQKDRNIKARLYAAAGILEYWLVNLSEDLVEIYRAPAGGEYQAISRHGRQETLRLRAFSDVELRVGDFLPAA